MNNKLPSCFKQEIIDDEALKTRALLSEFHVNTVCQQARCPNLNHCFKNLRLAFMILGNTCTRNCRFCAVRKSENVSLGINDDEPHRISRVVKMLGLKYVVVTSVTRDDLSDGGAAQFAKTIEAVHNIDKNIKIEVLIPDFKGDISSLKTVIAAYPEVIAHNIETVRRLYKAVRPQADYRVSLDVLRRIKEIYPSLTVKSSIILGLGETEEEVVCAMQDLKNTGLDILTLGQYLSPGAQHYPVKEFINNQQFKRYKDIGLALGLKVISSGPLIRSSYQAEEVYKELIYA
ncbi:MAG: lipoyl synthase [Candidatus Omnitrophica bacterium]|nr:lipoyl synthase [Candidatus Omnitrophota bacterium]